MRTKHCPFGQINTNGKCISDCHYNRESDCDCIGATGKTMNGPGHHEIFVTMAFIDGTHKEIVHKADGKYSVVNIYHTGGGKTS